MRCMRKQIEGHPSQGELQHHFLQSHLQEDLHRIVDIQLLAKGCYHAEFSVVDMVVKLLRMGPTRIYGVLLRFLQRELGFDQNVVNEHISHYFVFSITFQALSKEWKPVMSHMASLIAQLMDEESDVVRYVDGNFNLPYVRLIGRKRMMLPFICQATRNISGPIEGTKR